MNEGALGQHEIEIVAGPEAAALARAHLAQLSVPQLHHRMPDMRRVTGSAGTVPALVTISETASWTA